MAGERRSLTKVSSGDPALHERGELLASSPRRARGSRRASRRAPSRRAPREERDAGLDLLALRLDAARLAQLRARAGPRRRGRRARGRGRRLRVSPASRRHVPHPDELPSARSRGSGRRRRRPRSGRGTTPVGAGPAVEAGGAARRRGRRRPHGEDQRAEASANTRRMLAGRRVRRRRDARCDNGRTGRLLVVATPIGNLDDLVAPRAGRAERRRRVVYCEDTRRTGQPLRAPRPRRRRASPATGTTSTPAIAEILARLEAGETLALVSDAGTPLVSDPGERLVAAAAEAGHRVEAIPGPVGRHSRSSRCRGFPAVPFTFLGFPPAAARRARPLVRRGTPPAPGPPSSSSRRSASSSLSKALAAAWGDPGRPRPRAHEAPRGDPARPRLGGGRTLEARPGVKGELALAVAPPGDGAD